MPLNWIYRTLGWHQAAQIPTTTECDLSRVKTAVEPLIRNDAQQITHRQWLQTRAFDAWLAFFKKQYNNYHCGCKLASCDNRLVFNVAKCTRGFVLNFDEKIHNALDFQHLFDYFAQAFVEHGYTLQAADKRTYTCPSDKKETIERYYLKPPTTCLTEGKVEQCFGNITLTLHARNNEPIYLQCRAAHYRDMTLFQPSHSLDKLVACLVKTVQQNVLNNNVLNNNAVNNNAVNNNAINNNAVNNNAVNNNAVNN
jgi:hypothetical protein